MIATSLLVAALTGVCVSAMQDAASGNPVTLTNAACKPLTGDPVIQAPPYAQEKGAKGSSDGWWCELPHATKVPAGLVLRRRFFIPVYGTTYGEYWTWYGPPSKGAATATATPGTTTEGIVVSDLVYSEALAPTTLKHEPLPKGKRVEVASGLWGVETVKGDTVHVTFRFRQKGAPRYLTSVATVTVIGNKVPAATVLAVARLVNPL
jgi:hypothetical protein